MNRRIDKSPAVGFVEPRRGKRMTKNEQELLRILRESDDAKAVASFLFNQMYNYLQNQKIEKQ